MEHSPKYYKVLEYYQKGLWTKAMVRNAVEKEWITASEYKEITGEDYPEPNGR